MTASPAIIHDWLRSGVATAAALCAGVVAAIHAHAYAPPAWQLAGVALLTATSLRRHAAAGLAAALLLGAAVAGAALETGLERRLPLAEDGQQTTLQGRICSLPEAQVGRTRFLLCADGAGPVRAARLSWYGAPPLRAGDRVTLRARLRVPLSYLNPAGPDLALKDLIDGIAARGSVRSGSVTGRTAGLDALRGELAAALSEAAPRRGGALTALLLGDRAGLATSERDDLRRTGTAHLMAISGLHVMLVAGQVLLLSRRLRALHPRDGRRPWAPACLALIAAAAYAALAGNALPTRRALAMLAVLLALGLLRRPADPSRALVLALMAVLLLDPLAITQVGLWLSVFAVAALLELPRRGGMLLQLLRAQLMIILITAPLTASIGGVIGPAQVPANLIAIPVVASLVLPLLLVGGALTTMLGENPLAALLWGSADRILDALFLLLVQLAQLPGTTVPALPLPVAVTLALLGLLLVRALRAGDAPRVRGLLVLVCTLLSLALPPRPPPGELHATVVDVGQGLAVVLRTAEHSMVYDSGPSWPGGAAASLTLLPVLERRAVVRLDRILISHGDDDHAGGLPLLRAAFPEAEVLGHGGRPCRGGEVWTWDAVRFELLHPVDVGWRGNDGSCVLAVTAGGQRLLLTGDLERLGEAALVARAPDLASSVVIAPHHGSRTSSSPRLIRAVAAGDPALRWVIVPAGRGNRWGLPRIEVVARWRAAGAEVLSTASVGAVELVLGPGGVRLTSELERAARPWRAYGMMREP